MKVFLLKDVAQLGLANEIISVSDGYASNYLVPRGLGVIVTDNNKKQFQNRVRHVEHRKEIIATETSMLAEKIKGTTITLKRKTHEKTHLYGAVSAHEVIDLLSGKGIKASKSQIIFDKSIKDVGSYPVTIKLSSRLKPQVTLKVIAE